MSVGMIGRAIGPVVAAERLARPPEEGTYEPVRGIGFDGASESPCVGNVGFVGKVPIPSIIPERPGPEGAERPNGAMLGPVVEEMGVMGAYAAEVGILGIAGIVGIVGIADMDGAEESGAGMTGGRMGPGRPPPTPKVDNPDEREARLLMLDMEPLIA